MVLTLLEATGDTAWARGKVDIELLRASVELNLELTRAN